MFRDDGFSKRLTLALWSASPSRLLGRFADQSSKLQVWPVLGFVIAAGRLRVWPRLSQRLALKLLELSDVPVNGFPVNSQQPSDLPIGMPGRE